MNQEGPYKLIKIQQLEPRPQIQAKNISTQTLLSRFTYRWRWSTQDILYYKDTGLGPQRIISQKGDLCPSHPFILAFLHAYNQHGDVLITPDDIWLTIIKFVSHYIDQRSQSLRHKLVKHQGIQVIQVSQQVSSIQECEKKEKQWDFFFEKITEKIKQKTIQGVADIFQCNFSTSTPTHKVISTAMVMNSCKKFFLYRRRFCICGINNVYMSGERNDWTKMQEKLQKLVEYDTDGKLKEYIEHIRVVLAKFVETWDGKPCLQFWNQIMKEPETSQAYGGQQVEIQGWILHFMGIYGKGDLNRISDCDLIVPIELENDLTKKTQKLSLSCNWVSVSKLNERTYKPDIGVWIVKHGQK